MPRPLSALLTSLAMLLLAPGCSGSPKKAPEGVLRVNVGAEVADLDPQLVTGVPEHRVNTALFEGLADLDCATMKPVPAAAASWDISPDGLTYTFKLRGAKFHDGSAITAGNLYFRSRGA